MSLLSGLALIVFACDKSVQDGDSLLSDDVSPSGILKKIERIALVTFVGKSETNPTGYKILTQQMYDAFDSMATANKNIVKFIPVSRVVDNEAYLRVTKIRMPEASFSPVEGLTYIKVGEGEEYDLEPLIESLGVDAVMCIFACFDVSSRHAGSTRYLTCKVFAYLAVPPERLVWGSHERPIVFEELIPATIFSHFSLSLSISLRWVLLQGPSVSQCDELMMIALDTDSKLATKAGEEVFRTLVADIEEARR